MSVDYVELFLKKNDITNMDVVKEGNYIVFSGVTNRTQLDTYDDMFKEKWGKKYHFREYKGEVAYFEIKYK